MKKNFLCFIVLVMILTGCKIHQSNISPSSAVDQFLTGIQSHDMDTVKNISEWDENAIQSLQMNDIDYIENIDKQIQDKAHKALYGFTYEITDEKTEKDSAQVTVTFKTKNIEKTLKNSLNDIIQSASTLTKNKKNTEKDIQTEILISLYEILANTKEETKQTMILQLKKANHTWIVEKNKELEDLLIKNSEIFIHELQS